MSIKDFVADLIPVPPAIADGPSMIDRAEACIREQARLNAEAIMLYQRFEMLHIEMLATLREMRRRQE